MRQWRRCALTGALLWLTASAVALGRPQESPCLERTVQLNVITHNGQTVTDLSTSQFAAFYHKRAVRLLSITQNVGPRRVVILVDASGSMQPVRRFVFDVAEELLSDLPEGTQVGSVVFAQKVVGSWTLTTDRKAMQKQLEVLRNDRGLDNTIKGVTALLKTMQESLKTFGRPQEGDSLYVISDGEDNASNVYWRKLADQIVQSGIRVFAMRIHWVGGHLTPEEEESENHLQDIVIRTGGASLELPLSREKYLSVSHVEPLRDATGKPTPRAVEIALQSRLISGDSKMLIELPEATAKTGDWDLRFSDPQRSKGAILIYQHELPPCSIEYLSQ